MCELFGCTGWARKFRLQVLDVTGNTISRAITPHVEFQMRFVPLRSMCEEEWALLNLTLRLVAEFGAIGGRTVFKPLDENDRSNEQHHQDYGLIEIVTQSSPSRRIERKALQEYVLSSERRKVDQHDFAWASLRNFWCVKGMHLKRESRRRSSFNVAIGRKEDKAEKERRGRRIIRWSEFLEDNNDQASIWLAGRQGESKKIFSFKDPAAARRTFGFVKPGTIDFNQMRQRLKVVWPDFKDANFEAGEAIVESLFTNRTEHRS